MFNSVCHIKNEQSGQKPLNMHRNRSNMREFNTDKKKKPKKDEKENDIPKLKDVRKASQDKS